MRLLFGLILLIEAIVFAHREQQFVTWVDNFLKEAGFVMDHEWLLRIVHNHVLSQIQVLAFVLLASCVVFAGQKEEVVVKEHHPHNLHQAVTLQTHL